LGQRGVDVHLGLEKHFDDAIPRQRLRFDMLDVIDLGAERSFIVIDDALRHIVRRKSVVGPDDSDDRNIDVGKNINGRP
jgi:hypothetical protein